MLLMALLPAAAAADVKPSPMFNDHMVLQRDLPVPVWGSAAAGETVTVSLAGQSKAATADSLGKWLIKLDPMKAGGPYVLSVQGANKVEFKNVLVGEVWVGSGQSNMAGGMWGYTKNDPVLAKLAAATYPKLRLKKGGSAPWQEANPKNSPGFSALLFSFGARLQEELDVPVGLMAGAVGGTPSGNWLSQEAFNADAACQEVVRKATAKYSPEHARKGYEQALARWEKETAAAKQKGETRLPWKPQPPVKPGTCTRGTIGCHYETFIRPLIPYAIRGVLWDQGESGTAIDSVDQFTLMGALIRGWRKDWGQGDFPVIYVQKPSGGGCAWDPADPMTCQSDKFTPLPARLPELRDGGNRENYIRIMQYPMTGMATSSDLGPGVHPVNKSGYGARAARVALGMVYGKSVEIYGPCYQSHEIEGNKIRVKFTHVGQGLSARHGDKLQGFIIAGEDKKFCWADAVIEGDTVVVSSPAVNKPAAARYAWAGSCPWANLFNKDGLPALTFRTDAW